MRVPWHAVFSLSRGMLPSIVVSNSNELGTMVVKQRRLHV